MKQLYVREISLMGSLQREAAVLSIVLLVVPSLISSELDPKVADHRALHSAHVIEPILAILELARKSVFTTAWASFSCLEASPLGGHIPACSATPTAARAHFADCGFWPVTGISFVATSPVYIFLSLISISN